MKPTITEHQAQEKVEAYLQGALGALPGSARLKPFTRNRSECTDPTDGGPQGRFEISSTYEVTGLDTTKFADYFDAVIEWLSAHDFQVLTDSRPRDHYVFVRNNADAFDMSVQANDLGKFYLGATSPCVWPNGTPEPQAAGATEPEQPVAAPPPAPVRKPRRASVEDDDFAQTDWTDGGTSF